MSSVYDRCDELKSRIDQYRPFPKETLSSMRDYYRIGLTYASNALEGNSLTISETKVVIEYGLTIDGKPLRDVYEAVGHAKAYEYLYEIADNKPVTLEHILTLHQLFYQKLDEDNAGRLRKKRVFISGSRYPVAAPENLPALMKNFVDWFNKTEGSIHPVHFAVLVHQKFVFIHPFIDGNGRVARLLMNLALLRAGYTIAVISPILRGEYISCLEKAHTDETDFCNFIAQQVVETEKELLRLMEFTVSEPNYDRINDRSSDRIQVYDRINERINTVSINDTVNDTGLVTVYSIISENPGINTNRIADIFRKSIPTVSREIARLKGEGKIEFRGAKKTGGYFVLR